MMSWFKKSVLYFSLFSAAALTAALDDCSKELLLSYFPSSFVEKTLKDYNVPEDQWQAITEELKKRDATVVSLVEKKAQAMTPNPLKVSGHREEAVAIFRETLFEVFSNVMKEHGVTDPKVVMAMLDDIQYQKAKRFIECMEQHE